MSETITVSVHEEAMTLHMEGDYAGAYGVLGDAGDYYAATAETIVNGQMDHYMDVVVLVTFGAAQLYDILADPIDGYITTPLDGLFAPDRLGGEQPHLNGPY